MLILISLETCSTARLVSVILAFHCLPHESSFWESLQTRNLCWFGFTRFPLLGDTFPLRVIWHEYVFSFSWNTLPDLFLSPHIDRLWIELRECWPMIWREEWEGGSLCCNSWPFFDFSFCQAAGWCLHGDKIVTVASILHSYFSLNP